MFVRNITDIDDKIIDKARKLPGDLKTNVKKIALEYTNVYHLALNDLGLEKPDKEPKATEHIKDMQKIIKLLLDKGYAYKKGGDVYFSIKKFTEYGKLSKRDIESMRAETRTLSGENKEDPLDFALWKSSKPEEPEWNSPWGKGRPGWHIECSAMSGKYFKGSFDIHGGGLDLIFPHHENEIAQSKCAGYEFAKYWIHNGLLTINSQKMAKSLGNFITIGDFLEKHKDADLLKLLFLSAHYRSPVDYTEDKIGQMRKAKERFTILFEKIDRINPPSTIHPSTSLGTSNPLSNKEVDKLKAKFIEAMDDDFNTPKALGALFDMVNQANKIMDNGKNTKGEIQYFCELIKELGGLFGLFQKRSERADIEQNILQKIKKREEARKNKDFALSDKIRKELLKQGIILEDTKEDTIWRKKS